MNKNGLILFFAVFISGTVLAFSQANWTTYTASDGLSSNWVYDIDIDKSGNHWFCSYDGTVSHYDISSWHQYAANTTDKRAFGGYCIKKDKSGTIWFGTAEGLLKFDGQDWVQFGTTDGLPHKSVRDIIQAADGALWFATMGGVVRLSGTTWTSYTTSNGLYDNQVFCLYQDSDGTIWAGSVYGIQKFNGSSWDKMQACNWALDITEDGTGKIWFGTYGGVVVYDGADWRTITYTLPDSSDVLYSVRAVGADLVGNMWFGASRYYWVNGSTKIEKNQLLKYDGANWTYYDTTSGLPNNYVRAIFIDHLNNKWFGTDNGVAHFSESAAGIYIPQVPQTAVAPYPMRNSVIITVPDKLGEPRSVTIKRMDGTVIYSAELYRAGSVIEWDGRGIDGSDAPGGVYIYAIDFGNRKVVGRILKVR